MYTEWDDREQKQKREYVIIIDQTHTQTITTFSSSIISDILIVRYIQRKGERERERKREKNENIRKHYGHPNDLMY